MTEEEAKKRIDEIYDNAMKRLRALGEEQKKVIADYIKELENEKIKRIREELMK